MDLNVAVSTASESELFENGDMLFPILMGRENLKILASPGSESSGVSSLDAEEAKKLANEQLPSSSSPTLVSEPTSAVQTESESSDGSSSSDDADDDKPSPSEQSPTESEQSADEQEQRSDANDDDDAGDDSDDSESKGDIDVNDAKGNGLAEIADSDSVQLTSSATVDIEASSIDDGVTHAAAASAPDNAPLDVDDRIRYRNLKIVYDGRDILDLSGNLANKSWHTQYAHLPEINFKMLMDNRSQYNRLSSGYHENPNHDYILSKCGSCTFQYPVVITEKNDQVQPAASATAPLGKLLEETTNALLRRLTPVQSASVSAQRNAAAPATIDSTLALLQGSNMHAMNANNNFMMNNRSQMMTYQNNYKPTKNADALAAAVAAANNNQHTCFKKNINGTNAFYGNNTNAAAFNTLINQLGANAMNSNSAAASAFDSYFMNAANGSNNTPNNGHSYGHNHGHSHMHPNGNSANPSLNQVNIAALASLMNQSRQQQQQQQQQQQWYGLCRHNINKSGINCNANSHKSMPTYSHF